jgi:hypothetical protein
LDVHMLELDAASGEHDYGEHEIFPREWFLTTLSPLFNKGKIYLDC